MRLVPGCGVATGYNRSRMRSSTLTTPPGSCVSSLSRMPLNPRRREAASSEYNLAAAASGGSPRARIFDTQLRSESVRPGTGLKVKYAPKLSGEPSPGRSPSSMRLRRHAASGTPDGDPGIRERSQAGPVIGRVHPGRFRLWPLRRAWRPEMEAMRFPAPKIFIC
jgi:hypothetical protein